MQPTLTVSNIISEIYQHDINQERRSAALAAIPDQVVDDLDSPRTAPEGDQISDREPQAKRVEQRRRGSQKAPLKKPVAIRFSPEVIAYFKATGKGWQTRMDAALREWILDHVSN